ncbi:ATP-grasp peptide maturase system methyltransferase [Amycolatopsis aidingensis]|uniref:ATP-grasp peptide maturase system methyltransferase n=1 Tax=Amycolatopsis aidingensis TaxID=2842453 RepID=UPI001E3EA274|nr:ATP-grasp peptide maturase system methyltransferase [Amycolatopsis aidingensis]
MTTSLDTEWPALARRLARDLEQSGKLSDPAWRAAVCAVPRHELVPDYFQQDRTGTWTRSDTTTDEGRRQWLEKIYSNSVLITALRQDTRPPRVLSSSTQPGLMTRMLQALDVREGHRVLEIGTGTGYNAALLCHRLGSAGVYSVDVEPGLISTARKRLRHLGFTPTLVTCDGSAGLPVHAPFDRIIATCAVPAIPWTWVEQVPVGGAVLTDLKIAPNAGSLVRVTRTGLNRAEGRFDSTYAAFMGLRSQPGEPDRSPAWAHRDATSIERHMTTVDPQTPWNSMIVWFLAAFDIGPDISIGFAGSTDTDAARPPDVSLTTPDGSWARISMGITDSGGHEVAQGGPRRLWQIIESAHDLWNQLDRPGWDRFGLTVTPSEQTVWLDQPDSPRRWPIAQ